MRLLQRTTKLNVALLAAALVGTAFLTSGCSDSSPIAPTATISDEVTFVGGGKKDGGGKKTKDSTTTDSTVHSMDGGGKYAVGD